MRYFIHTSSYSDCRPHHLAKFVTVHPIDRRTASNPRDVPAYGGDDKWWYDEGENHRVENGEISRDMPPRKKWVIDVDDLIQLINEVGFVTVTVPQDDHKEQFHTLQIPDNY